MGRIYFVDHNTRTTTWERPEPLPPGYSYISLFLGYEPLLFDKGNRAGGRRIIKSEIFLEIQLS